MSPEYKEWLLNPDNNDFRTMLLELVHSAGKVYLSTLPYMTKDGTPYDSWLVSFPVIEEFLYTNTTVGDFTAINTFDPDTWQSLNFTGKECNFFFGDIRWEREQFHPVASAVISSVTRDDFEFSFDLVDRGFLLEEKIPMETISGESTALTPLAFGTIFNARPVLTDYASQTYSVGCVGGSGLVLKDNGVPVGFTSNDLNDKITLDSTPHGELTFGVKSGYGDIQTVANHILGLGGFQPVTTYGLAAWQNLADIGLWLDGEKTYSEVLDLITNSLGCWWRLTPLGTVEIVSDQNPPIDLTLTTDDFVTLTPSSSVAPVKAVELNYRKNYAVLSNEVLAGGLSAEVFTPEEAVLLSQEYTQISTTISVDTGVFSSSHVRNSLLAEGTEAILLKELLVNRFGKKTTDYTGEMRAVAFGLRVGDRVNVDYPGVQGIALITHLGKGDEGLISSVGLRF